MPTDLPREMVTFKPDIHEILEDLRKQRGGSMSQLIADLVETALEFVEDLALNDIAETRLKTFSRDDAISIEEMTKWNNARKTK